MFCSLLMIPIMYILLSLACPSIITYKERDYTVTLNMENCRITKLQEKKV